MRKQFLMVPALLTLIFGALFVRLPIAAAQRADDFRIFDPVADVFFEIDERFYREVDAEALQRGMIRGMIEALDDPYTEYIPPANLQNFDKLVRGEIEAYGNGLAEKPEIVALSKADALDADTLKSQVAKLKRAAGETQIYDLRRPSGTQLIEIGRASCRERV